jgi:hypothetical protein
MTPVSTRLVPAALPLALLAAVLVAFAERTDRRWDECRDPVALLDTDRIAGSHQERELTGRYGAGLFQFSDGRVEPALAWSRYQVIRSARPFDLQHEPLSSMRYPIVPDTTRLEWLDVDGTRVPIRLAYLQATDAVHLVGYLFVYDGEPVTSPLPRQLATALPQLVRGTRPLTLLRVDLMDAGSDPGRSERAARDWLASAWRAYREACAS